MRKLAAIRSLLLLLLLACFYSTRAEASSYLKCLEQAKGQLITWDSRWEADRSDNGVRYTVSNVRVVNRIPDRTVTLELAARTPGPKQHRVLVVSTEEKARTVCESFAVERRTLALPGEKTGRIGTDLTEPALPFIRYTKDGWVRAKKPTRSFDIEICRVHQQEFSCLSKEKERFGIMLKTVEEEIRWSGT